MFSIAYSCVISKIRVSLCADGTREFTKCDDKEHWLRNNKNISVKSEQLKRNYWADCELKWVAAVVRIHKWGSCRFLDLQGWVFTFLLLRKLIDCFKLLIYALINFYNLKLKLNRNFNLKI